MPELVEVRDEDILKLPDFSLDDLTGKRTGCEVGRSALLSPRNEVLKLVDSTHYIINHKDLLPLLDVVLTERLPAPAFTKRIFLSEDFSHMEADYKTSTSIFWPYQGPSGSPNITINLELGITLMNMVGGAPKLFLVAWSRVKEICLPTFSEPYLLRKEVDETVIKGKIEVEYSLCCQAFARLPAMFQKMQAQSLSRVEALEHVSHMTLTGDDRDGLVSHVQSEFPETGGNVFDFFMICSFMATHLASRARLRKVHNQICEELAPSELCFSGTPHRWLKHQ